MFWLLIAIIVGSIALDQLTKWLTVVYLNLHESIPLWDGVFHFTYERNPGAAWGILKDNRWVFMVFSTVAIIGLSIYLFGFCKQSKWIKIPIAMIIGGGIGNMIDRVLLGYVIDFLDFTLIDFPVFIVADSFVTVGAFWLIGVLVLETVREIKQERIKKKAAVSDRADVTDDKQEAHDED